MSQPRHVRPEQHGTITGYAYGCREQCCRDANTARARRLRKARALGTPFPAQRVAAAPTRRVVQRLHDQGYSDRQLSRLFGLNHAALYRLRNGTGAYIARETAERVEHGARLTLRTQPVDHLAARYVSPLAARRRLRALMAIGWRLPDIAARLGQTGGALSPLLYLDGRHITPARDAQIRDVYDELWRTPGPSEATRRHAARHGWATPLELDDDRIDDPNYTPTLHRLDDVALRRQRRELITERRQQVLQFTDRGLDAADIARRLGVSADVVQADRRRAERDAS